ncbi:phage late control D family protein [Duganella phyllosphaerae]|uniref:Phage late control gene D protein n=1 Tax=Duganella phyllosphaerae TaxID=762836 RepID=A0A1E7WJ76_9BURK|nr:phage late control D family protein [Duganella phyllosphaerae]OEZ98776.1 phage late control gene D protein [Duganella phyllosphaerae]
MTDHIPTFKISIEDKDLTAIVSPRLVNLTLNLCRGDESDQLDISLDDSDGKLALPPRGAQIAVALGWQSSGLVDMGKFTVDEVEHSGAPDTITLRARSANLIDKFKRQEERSFHNTTLGAIIELIAFQNELASGISASLRDTGVPHIDQTHESDAAFLRRLGKKYDAVATVKNDTLLFIPINQSRTVSGKALPVITITRALGDGHRYHSAESNAYTGVRAFWHDERYARRRSVVAGVPGNSKRLRTIFATEADARASAVAEWQRILRGLATFEMSLALGNPAVFPQSPVTVKGFKPEIDATPWLSTKVTHSLGGSGFTTRVEFETKTEVVEAEREEEKDPDEGITGVLAKWTDVAAKKKKEGQEQAGAAGTLKTLEHIYHSKQAAKRAVLHAWRHIQEVRNIIRENGE